MLALAIVVLGLSVELSTGSSRTTAYKPGWNGKALTPPMGWRSWNAFGNNINRTIIDNNLAALTAKIWKVHGSDAFMSLADMGYNDFGIDEGWEDCKAGPAGTQHDAAGNPIINTTRFPDLASLVAAAHAEKLEIGWYLNGCACGETSEHTINYEGDIKQLHALGFDAAKFDNCGAQKNMTLYASLMQATGKAYMIENCHWGQCWDIDGDPDANSCPTTEWCPFNMYRTSGDVAPVPTSWIHNLQTTIKFRDLKAPLSVPGCWAYPDMMEVGMVQGPSGPGDFGWNRAHFGAWAISSAPLVIGADLTDNAVMQKAMPILSNTEAIAINQNWAGHPGMLVQGHGNEGKFVVANTCDESDPTQQGWSYDDAAKTVKGPGGWCLDNRTESFSSGQLELRPCDGSAFQQFGFDTSGVPPVPPSPSPPANKNVTAGVLQSCIGSIGPSSRPGACGCSAGVGMTGPCCVEVNGWWGWNIGPSSCSATNPNEVVAFVDGTVQFVLRPGRKCWSLWDYPQTGYEVQVWAKPQPHGAVAVLVINSNQVGTGNATVTLKALNLAGTVSVRDVWQHTDNGTITGQLSTGAIPPADSRFYLLAPTSAAAPAARQLTGRGDSDS